MDKTRTRRGLIFGSSAIGLLIGLFLGILIVNPQSEFGWELFLEYLKVFLSWPVVFLFVALIVIWRFRDSLSAWIKNMSVRLPGDIEVGQGQPPPPEATVTEMPIEAEEAAITSAENASTVGSDPQTIDSLLAALAVEQERTTGWYFTFLNLYFVMNTKRVLAWLAKLPPTPVTVYHDEWELTVLTRQERESILMALAAYQVVSINEGFISVMPIGHDFVEWANISKLPGPAPRMRIPPPSLIVPDLTSPPDK